MNEVDFVESDGTVVEMVPGLTGDYCRDSNLNSDRSGVSFDSLVDGDTGTAIACDTPAEVGEVAFILRGPADATKLTMHYGRPLYAPGWKILRDGVVVLEEESNRGVDWKPSGVEYTYDLTRGKSLRRL